MSSTTPAAAPTPQDRPERTATAAPAGVPMRALLAACASAAAVSTPPARPAPAPARPEPSAPPRAA
ncbi:hypothetical protein KNE206_22480 [Kitasatospora sp. NE20-6]|uniref:hypothetical protein n=1 Tax=Kitasatospora sp. NE20-6 TaxID=2859066 RepID=UPI0034DC21F6